MATVETSIEARVKKIIVYTLGIDESDITPQASFINDLGADDLDTVELIIAFEEEFDISIPDEDAENLLTVGSVVDYITDHLEGKE